MIIENFRKFDKIVVHKDDIDNILKEVESDIVISCLRGDFKQQIDLHIKVARYL